MFETDPSIRHGLVELCSPAKCIEYVEKCDRHVDEDDQTEQGIWNQNVTGGHVLSALLRTWYKGMRAFHVFEGRCFVQFGDVNLTKLEISSNMIKYNSKLSVFIFYLVRFHIGHFVCLSLFLVDHDHDFASKKIPSWGDNVGTKCPHHWLDRSITSSGELLSKLIFITEL